MKIKFILITFMFLIMAGQVPAQKTDKVKKALVAYFSWSGNTRLLAEQIAGAAGADTYEIVPAKAYPSNYSACVTQARREKQGVEKPALKGTLPDLKEYDVIFVGFPNWLGTMPMPVVTFLDKVSLKGKTVIPFITHGGGGRQQCFTDFRKMTGGATIIEGPVLEGSSVKTSKSKIEKWVHDKIK